MPEDNQEQKSNQQTEGNVNPDAQTDPVDPTPDELEEAGKQMDDLDDKQAGDTDADGQPDPPEPGNELDTSMHVKDVDVPWDVVQAQEGLPQGEIAGGYFMFNGNPVLVCAGGFYGKHEGNVQRLAVKVLIDNI